MLTYKRGKVKDKVDVKAKDFYTYYKSLQRPNSRQINYEKFRTIIKMFNAAIMSEVIIKAYDFTLPYKLGKLCVRKFKVKNKIENNKVIIKNPVDWKKTKALWEEDEEAFKNKKLIRIDNSHSNGYIARICHKGEKSTLTNAKAYKFKAIRSNKLLLSKILKDKELKIDYFEY